MKMEDEEQARIESMKELIDTHRQRYILTCEEDCWCWEVEAVICGLEEREKCHKLKHKEVTLSTHS